MKKSSITLLALIVGLVLTASVFAGDKEAIKSQVDDIAQAINGGKMASDFKEAAEREPYYVYIMAEDGQLLVHPSLEGKNLKEVAAPAYEAVGKATEEGTWVKYEWKGAEKNAYVRKTKAGPIVGSGY